MKWEHDDELVVEIYAGWVRAALLTQYRAVVELGQRLPPGVNAQGKLRVRSWESIRSKLRSFLDLKVPHSVLRHRAMKGERV